MNTNSPKREVPSTLRRILDMDVVLTKKFVTFCSTYLPPETYKVQYKMLELSCHGIPWFAFWIAFTWLFNNPSLIQMQVNMLLGLLIDIILVAVIKAYVRRRRPKANKDDVLGQLGPDKYSFPSGHASRAVLVTVFFLCLHGTSVIAWPAFLAWSLAVCISRVLMHRHHILDVLAGIALGLAEGMILHYFWLSENTSQWIMSSLTDEKLEGGSYHV